MENIVQGSILGDQLPQFAQDLGVPQDMEFSVLKLGKSRTSLETNQSFWKHDAVIRKNLD